MSIKGTVTKGGKAIDLATLLDSVEPSDLFTVSEEHQKAMDKIHALVSVRERAPKEIYERLRSLGYEESIAREAVESAIRCGLIDESRYASAYIRGKVNSNWGKGRILSALRDAGISESAIQESAWLLPSQAEEYERAMRELEKRPARSKNPMATYVRRLTAKGFSQNLSIAVAADYLERQKSQMDCGSI